VIARRRNTNGARDDGAAVGAWDAPEGRHSCRPPTARRREHQRRGATVMRSWHMATRAPGTAMTGRDVGAAGPVPPGRCRRAGAAGPVPPGRCRRAGAAGPVPPGRCRRAVGAV